MRDKHMTNLFCKFGKIIDVNVPMKSDKDSLNRGFCVVEFEKKEQAQKAIDALHNQKWKGRTLAVEFSVPKGSYDARIKGIVEHTNLDEKTAILPKVLRDEKKEEEKVKEQKEKEKKEYEENNKAKIKK